MYIVSANQSQVVDSAFVERFVLVEKPDAVRQVTTTRACLECAYNPYNMAANDDRQKEG